MTMFDVLIADIDCKPHEVQYEIDGLRYTSTKLPAATALDLMPRLVRLTGHGFLARLFDRSLQTKLIPLQIDLDAERERMGSEPSEEDRQTLAALRKAKQDAGEFAEHVVLSIASKADQVGLADLAVALLQGTRCDKVRPMGQGGYVAGTPGKPDFDTFNAHFAGEFQHLLRVVLFVARHNYAGPTLGSRSTSGSRSTRQDGPGSTRGSDPRTSTHSSPT